jgi:hypothetical protein
LLSTAAAALTVTPSPTPTPIPTVNECNPSAHDCPVGKECNCCCGTWVCMPPYLPCCALPCSDPTQLPTPRPPASTATPTFTPTCQSYQFHVPGCCDFSDTQPQRSCFDLVDAPLGGVCMLEGGQPRGCPEAVICNYATGRCELEAPPTPTPTPTGLIIGIGEFCEPDRICPLPLLCLIDPPHQALVCSCVGDCDANAAVTVDELVTLVNVALGNMAVSVCPLGDANSDEKITVDEILQAVSNALYGCGVTLPTPTPTPVLYHGHTCCECEKTACTDFAWVEVEPTCPAGCQTFLDAECEAPCQGGPLSGPAVCVPLTPCTTDADCDDGNGCTVDHCTTNGCSHDCVCV